MFVLETVLCVALSATYDCPMNPASVSVSSSTCCWQYLPVLPCPQWQVKVPSCSSHDPPGSQGEKEHGEGGGEGQHRPGDCFLYPCLQWQVPPSHSAPLATQSPCARQVPCPSTPSTTTLCPTARVSLHPCPPSSHSLHCWPENCSLHWHCPVCSSHSPPTDPWEEHRQGWHPWVGLRHMLGGQEGAVVMHRPFEDIPIVFCWSHSAFFSRQELSY